MISLQICYVFVSLGGLFFTVSLHLYSATYTEVKTRSRRTRIEGGTMYVPERWEYMWLVNTSPLLTTYNIRDSAIATLSGNAPLTSTDQAHLTQTRVQRNAEGFRVIVIL